MQNFANFMKISCLQYIFSVVEFLDALQNNLFPVFPVFEDTPIPWCLPYLMAYNIIFLSDIWFYPYNVFQSFWSFYLSLKSVLCGAGDIAQWLSWHAILQKGMDVLIHTGQFTITCNNSFREFHTFFWPQQHPHIHELHTHPHIYLKYLK